MEASGTPATWLSLLFPYTKLKFGKPFLKALLKQERKILMVSPLQRAMTGTSAAERYGHIIRKNQIILGHAAFAYHRCSVFLQVSFLC